MDVITFGETMALFAPENGGLMKYASSYNRKFGGAESNVAIGLSRLGHNVGWISKVGNDELGKGMVAFIRGEGVDVSQVKVVEAPTGIYFKEIRNHSDVRVQYYRHGSAASTLTKADILDEYVSQAKYLHITGITPALSDSCYETVLHAMKKAKEIGVTIIFDPNLRKKLWSEEKARKVLLEIVSQSDIILPGVAEGEFLFGESDISTLGDKFLSHGAKLVIIKDGANGAHYFNEGEEGFVPAFKVEQVIDPVGAGDGFAAGFISGLLDQLSITDALTRANAVGAMVTQVSGDVEGLPDQNELLDFLKQDNEDVKR
ncbi:sugar kinase [Halalkalibacter kiskunsagensis]|uniref:Sugar kinase n=1 Tax=Halalkalibacter kiskunsagensis TaxID=1548599 RepID=A0ABV6KCB5_9BACI